MKNKTCENLRTSDLKMFFEVIVLGLKRKHNAFSIATRIYHKIWPKAIESEFQRTKAFLTNDKDQECNDAMIEQIVERFRDPHLYRTFLPISTLTGIILLSLKIADEVTTLEKIAEELISFFEFHDMKQNTARNKNKADKMARKVQFGSQNEEIHEKISKNMENNFSVKSDEKQKKMIRMRMEEYLDPFKVTNEEVILLNWLNFNVIYEDLFKFTGLRLSSMSTSKTIFKFAASVLTDLHFTKILATDFSNDDIFAVVSFFAFKLHRKSIIIEQIIGNENQTLLKTNSEAVGDQNFSNLDFMFENNTAYPLANSQKKDLLVELNIVDDRFFTPINSEYKTQDENKIRAEIANLLVGFDYNYEKVQNFLVILIEFYEKTILNESESDFE